jgi:hypothetical protein
MRKLLQETSKADEAARATCVEQLYRKMRSFTSSAGMAGILYVAKFGAAVKRCSRRCSTSPRPSAPPP